MLTSGCSLIHLAATRCSPEQIARALQYGENPNAEDSLGRTPLHCLLAPVGGQPTEEKEERVRDGVRMLLEAGADVDRMNKFGWSAKADLHRLARLGWRVVDAAPSMRRRVRM